jgi:hypothetical protein
MAGWLGGWVDDWLAGLDGWMGGWMDGWADGRVDGWMAGWVGSSISPPRRQVTTPPRQQVTTPPRRCPRRPRRRCQAVSAVGGLGRASHSGWRQRPDAPRRERKIGPGIKGTPASFFVCIRQSFPSLAREAWQ